MKYSNIKVMVEGKNVNNYLKWLIKNKINIISLNIIKHSELILVVNYKDYPLLKKYSKTYKITIIKKYGKLRLIDKIKNNIVILSCLIISIFFIYALSNIIFSIDIVYNDQVIVDKIYKELSKYNIKKFARKKSYNYLSKVKEKILNDNKDILEWIEIEESGTKYIVRLVERKKQKTIKTYQFQSICAKKNAVISSIKAFSGEKQKQINEYVKKGDTVISGILTKPDGTNIYTKATGKVYGEVWYKVSIEYPLYYHEEKITGKNKNIIAITFLNKKFSLFPYRIYKQFKLYSKPITENNYLPIKVTKEKLYELIIEERIYTQEEAIDKAFDEVTKKMLERNSNITKIKDIKILNKENINSGIKLNLFVSTIEDITETIELKQEIEP